MKQKTFLQVAAGIFSVIAVLHVLRIALGWEAVIGGLTLPLWLSGVAALASAFLAYNAFTLAK